MSFNIMKTMYNERGKKQHILLTDGLSEILSYSDVNEAINMVHLLNENSDNRTEYELRPTHSMASANNRVDNNIADENTIISSKGETDISIEARMKHMDESDIAYNRGKYGTNIDADAQADIQRMMDLLGASEDDTDDPSD